jgi:ATP-binding cassette subfamily B (MDR/TAP) protein 1
MAAREHIEMSCPEGCEQSPGEKTQLTVAADSHRPGDPVKSNKNQTAGDSKDSYISLWTLLFKYADSTDLWLMAFGTLGTVGDGLSTPGMLIILTSILNTISDPSVDLVGNLNKLILRLLYFGSGVMVAAFLEAFCWTRTAQRQASRMRIKYLKAVLRQDEGFFDTQGTTTSEVVTSVSTDTLVIQDVFSEKLPSFIMNTAFFFASYFTAFYLSWRLAVAALPFVFLLLIPAVLSVRIMVRTSGKLNEARLVAGNIAEEALSSIRTVFSFVGEERTMAKFSNALNETVKLGLKQGFVKGIAVGSGGACLSIWAFNAWYGSRLVMYHGARGGNIFITTLCLLMGGLGVGNALPNIRCISEARVAGKRIFEIIDREPIIDSDDPKGEILREVSGEVEFRNVEFVYPSRPETKIFHNFCLTIPASKTVALVGGSGSGKSTVVALIERFYDPLAGQILLDGVNTKALQLKWFRSQIGFVSQEPALFATSIKENILFGKEGASMDEVIAAAKSSNAHNFIGQLPDGYDTQVGERGVQMSGGQKQRIAIARAVIRDPRLLLLDEATSALDAESEKIVQGALDQASVGRTTIIVAHRLSTIRNADMISVVQAGQVIESGSHEDLIYKPNGAYAALVQLQQAAADKPNERLESHSMRDSSFRARSSSMYSRSSSNASVSGINPEGVQEDEAPSASSFSRLLLLNSPEWKQALLGCTGAIGFGAIVPLYSFFIGSVLSIFLLQDHKEIKSKIKEYCFIFVAMGLISYLMSVLQNYYFQAMAEYLTKRVRERMFSKILTFEVGWFDKDENSTGDICSRLETEATMVRSLVGDSLSLLVQTVSSVALAFTMGLIIAWRLAIVIIAAQPMVVLCFYTKQVLLKILSKKFVKAQDRGSQLAAEAVANHRTISAFSSQEKILRLFKKTQEGPERDGFKQSFIAGAVLGFALLFNVCNSALDFWYGGHLVAKGDMTAKALFQTFFILMTTGNMIAEAGGMSSDLVKGSNAVKSLFRILDRESRINPDDEKGEKTDAIEGNIDVKNVDFAYPARPDAIILKNFCLRIKAGTSMAIVGQSGSGKSTVVGLIERFYDPLKGTVRIDGRDIKTFNLRSLRKHIALVGQEPILFAGSIRDNILYGKDNATEAEMIEAAKAANAHGYISALEQGYETNCGDRGAQLSGGQKQRVAIARAIIKNPRILLLDEATSALDSQSEQIVQEALDRIMVGRTSVVIAHRLTTIQHADSIAVIQDGKVIEQGSHSYLMGKGEGSPYYSLVNMERRNNKTTVSIS